MEVLTYDKDVDYSRKDDGFHGEGLVANVATCDVLRTVENDLRMDSCTLYIPSGDWWMLTGFQCPWEAEEETAQLAFVTKMPPLLIPDTVFFWDIC